MILFLLNQILTEVKTIAQNVQEVQIWNLFIGICLTQMTSSTHEPPILISEVSFIHVDLHFSSVFMLQ